LKANKTVYPLPKTINIPMKSKKNKSEMEKYTIEYNDKCIMTTNLSKYAENNNLANSVIQISDGKLRFVNSKVSEPLTFKYLEKALTQIIKSESQVKQIIEHIKTNRDTKIISEIKRINNN
jgi:hypothetical protein